MSSAASSPLLTSLLAAPLPQRGISWLDAARHENREAFAAGGLPDTRVEAWKYTPLRALSQRSFASGDSDAGTRAVDPALFALPGVDGPRLVFVNGVFRADLSALDALPDGLVLQPLSRALDDDAEPLRFVLSTAWCCASLREPGSPRQCNWYSSAPWRRQNWRGTRAT